MNKEEYKNIKDGTKLGITLRNGMSYTGKLASMYVGGNRTPLRKIREVELDGFDGDGILINDDNYRDFKLLKVGVKK